MRKTKQNLQDIFEEHSPNEPMSEEISKFYMGVMLSGNEILDSPLKTIDKDSDEYKHFKPLIEDFVPQVFLKRLQNLGNRDISLAALVVLSEGFDSPGNAVMYAYYLSMKTEENQVIDLNRFAEIFPMGTFNKKQLNEIWDKQKVGKDRPESQCIGAPDNLIDYVSVW